LKRLSVIASEAKRSSLSASAPLQESLDQAARLDGFASLATTVG
jgi:hypothetical protein